MEAEKKALKEELKQFDKMRKMTDKFQQKLKIEDMADRRASAIMKPMMFKSNRNIIQVPMTTKSKDMIPKVLQLDEDYFNIKSKQKDKLLSASLKHD